MEPSTKPTARNPFEVFGPIPTELPPLQLEDLKRVSGELTPHTKLPSLPSPENMGLRRPEILEAAYRTILLELGCDLEHQHFEDTPRRAARAILEMTRREPINSRTFPSDGVGHAGMVYQNGIWVTSLCPHHMLPWFGTVCIAYLPASAVLGLSKFSRIVRHAAAGFHTQEEVTATIAHLLSEQAILNPRGVGVSIRAYHTCMALRGVRDSGVDTTTQYLTGPFRDDPSTRAEFIGLVKHPPIMA